MSRPEEPRLKTDPAELEPLSPEDVTTIYEALLKQGNRGFPHYGKFLEVLNSYWNFVLRPKLESMRLTKAPQVGGVPPLTMIKNAIVTRWLESRAEAGTSVGGMAADAIGQPVMQATLKSFHFAGLKRSSFGSEAAMEVVGLSRDRHVPNARVFLREDLSYDATYDYLQAHQKLKIQDLIFSEDQGGYDIVTPKDNALSGEDPDIGAPEIVSSPWPPSWWAGAVASRPDVPPVNPGAVFRLRFDPVLLHRYRLSPARLAAEMEVTLNKGEASKVEERAFYCLGSPLAQAEAYVMVYTNILIGKRGEEEAKAELGNFGDELSTHVFFFDFARHRILSCPVSGDRFLAEGIVVSTSAAGIALSIETKLPGRPGEPATYSWLIDKSAIKNGVTPYKLGKLLAAAGVRLTKVGRLSVSPDPSRSLEREGVVYYSEAGWAEDPAGAEPAWLSYLRGLESWRGTVELQMAAPPAFPTFEGAEARPGEADTPMKFLRWAVGLANQRLAVRDRRSKELNSLPFVHAPDASDPLERFALLGTLHFLETSQNDLKTLLTHPDVDPRFTVANQFRSNKTKNSEGITEILGIMALRNYVFEEFYDLITNGGDYIDPQHVALVVDYMTHLGKPIPLTPVGFAQRGVSTTDEAYQGRATNTYLQSAFKGIVERITIASAIHLGQPIPQGTGWVSPLIKGFSDSEPTVLERLPGEVRKPGAPPSKVELREAALRETLSRAIDALLRDAPEEER